MAKRKDSRNTRTCGEAIVALLEQYGVEIVFGVPGVHTLELYRGLVGSKIRHVLPRHEQGAGFMADGYARASGKPGVCFLITGPGVTNAATPIGQAFSDSVPMLVISSVNETRLLGKGRGELHELPDQQQLMSACTAFSAHVKAPAEFPAVLARAFDVFNSERPRPVHIEVPIDIFELEVAEDWVPLPAAQKPMPKASDIVEATEFLQKAHSPLLIVGGGAKRGEDAILEIAEKLSAPVVTSVAGSGLLPCDHPLSLGSTLISQATQDLISAADVVLVAGCELASTDSWGFEYNFTGKLIRIDIDQNQFENFVKADLELCCDAGEALRQIAQGLAAGRHEDRLGSAKRAVGHALSAFDASLSADENIRRKAFETVVNAMPDDTLIACDMTQIGYTGHGVFRPRTSGRMLFPQGYGTLGYGLPAAFGAQLGAPEKPVIAFAGDGGILYTMQEMMTAKEEQLPVIVILWNNASLKQIRDGFVDRGIEPIAVDPMTPDYQLLAKGFGWGTTTVQSYQALHDAVIDARKQVADHRCPHMIEVLVKQL